MNNKLTYCILAFVTAACASTTPEVLPISPTNSATDDAESNVELSSREMRINSPQLYINMVDGGNAFERLNDGTYRGIDLATGDNFDFNAGEYTTTADGTATLSGAVLRINGARIGYSFARLLATDGVVNWYQIITDSATISITIDTSAFE
jgi:hypothetical protein